MTSQAPSILILGGNSAIAGHLCSLLPGARSLARSGGAAGVTQIGDYRELTAKDFAGVSTVINCAGIVRGNEAELRAVNVELQTTLAAAARRAGVARYVGIGSFSIFGPRNRIDASTPAAPNDAYGRSKYEGEEALFRLQTDGFRVLSVAFPTIIGTTRAGKVERMLKLWRRVGAWPAPPGDIRRVMIGARAAARVLAHAVTGGATGRVLAADPATFCYRTAAQWLREDVGGVFGVLPTPRGAVAILRCASPSLYHSIMADSVLEPSCNYMIQCGLDSSLRSELAAAVMRRNARP